ncbi:repressor [Kosakonia phage Kc166BP]|nr:repressor [Kosakonia phage Kc166BP]
MIQNWNGQQKDFTNRKATSLPDGGKDPIDRICLAYGFTSRQALCRHLDVSQSTMANRVARANFPADWVLICAMETGAPLEWLVYGRGELTTNPFESGSYENESPEPDDTQMRYFEIQNGVIHQQKWISVPNELVPSDAMSPRIVVVEGFTWFVDDFNGSLVDGFWLVEMDGITTIRELYRLPGGRIKVENGKHSFECRAEEINVLGKAISRTEKL